MKPIQIIIILLMAIEFSLNAQSFELYKGDTINRVDANQFKQSYWIVFNEDKTKIKEEGNYKDNKKVGAWKKYFDNGKIKQELVYVDNKPNGYAKFYYENGNISEEGLWKNNKWVGDYKFYFENGNLSYEWGYNESGKRSGVQKYYHENGKVMIEGEWNEGKESGVIKEFDESGNLVSEKNYNDGQLDASSVKVYSASKNNNQSATNTVKKDTIRVNSTTNTNNLDVFNGNGFNKLFNKRGLIEQEGDFANGVLMKGKKFYYNAEGKLTKTAIYKDGKVLNIIYVEKQ
ncbi:MAG TPA: hypothetical protein DDX39_09345 [Bacteroidales bacterium]|nr:MAG: hypothetical protein A2W98_15250 [Bacteroidetes bacterium GWF2_33_38]OFY74836.1 MAG: hypothetical protein A2265_05665 [Bacteroidetes bacterium RIFOXYA12_FULL_33_9]OFY85911.1 MAG: hypothetical protein A2236_08720 [Bacteroidetes bacterium RIFOXYA2_FULL_33_7]HBF88834.1 hypothetical protein [Bacteroidales bacterium]